MKRFLGIVFLLITISLSSYAQHSIQGKVLDKKSEGSIEMATIRLLNAKDSTLVKGIMTDQYGAFTLSKVNEGKYILDIRFLGYTRSLLNVSMAGKGLILKNIYLESSDNALKEVSINGMTAQMAVKGDTIEYNSAAFKTEANAVVEDLLKKLPGVVVDTDGKITVNGEEIKKIRVDGKKFFEGDIAMATKNLPVDMIDKIQVVDQKSDMSKLTGFEDDNTERIINLTTKANRKKGVFGNLIFGGGADKDGGFRYDENAFINILNGNAQTAIIAGANNTNTQRSGRGRGGMGGGSGITATQNLGLNNNTEISKTLKVGGNGSYNHSTNSSKTESEKESYLSGATDITKDSTTSNRENDQANLRLEMEWNIDTLTTLIVQPTLNYNKSFSESNNDNFFQTDGVQKSKSDSNNSNSSNGLDANMRLTFNRKSKVKPGRNFTINVDGGLSNSNSDGTYYSQKMMIDSTSLIDQQSKNLSDEYTINARTSFVEPLWNLKNFIELAASFNSRLRSSDRQQFNDLNNDGVYSDLDTQFSNSFSNNSFTESLELNFRHQETDYNYLLGMKAEPTQNFSTNNYLDGYDLTRENKVMNYSPVASFRYNFGRKKFARLEYRGRTGQPSIDQMQPVRTNSLTNETIGNMALNPSFDQNLRLMYSSFNAERYSSINFGINGSYTTDALVSNTISDQTGKRYTQTVNAANKPFSGSANFMFNTPIIKNRLQFNTLTDVSYQQYYGYSSRSMLANPLDENGNLFLGELSNTKRQGASENLGLTFTTDVIEIGLRGSVKYSRSLNNLTSNRLTKDYTSSGNVNLHLPYNFTITNNLDYTTMEGYSAFSKDQWIWNATIDKALFKNKGTLSLKLYDILKQKLNIRENISDNYREITRSNQLTSYFMLSFAYKLAKFGGGASTSDMFRGGGRGGRGGDHGGYSGPPPGMD